MKPMMETLSRILLIPALATTFALLDQARAGEPDDSPKAEAIAKPEQPDHQARPAAAGSAAAPDAAALKKQKEKQSYAFGMAFGSQLRKQPLDVEADSFVQGIRDVLSGGKTRMTEQEARAVIADMQGSLKKQKTFVQAEQRLKNKKEGEAFLAENKAKEGVVTRESGLQYKILKPGSGKKPTLDDTVVVHYRGTLVDGTEFDSSYKRNRPGTFALKKVIKGWSEALQLMSVGSKWQLFIPSTLAYGERSAGRTIGPNAALIFEAELISIKDPSGSGAQAADKKDSTTSDVSANRDLPGPVRQEMPEQAAPPAALTGIHVSYKLDPRLSGPTYGGERWVSPPTYSGASAQDTVEAKVEGIDAKGRPVKISPRWTPADPEMVAVSPSEGNAVKITVKRPGQTSLQVASQEVSKKLVIKAASRGGAMQVEISH